MRHLKRRKQKPHKTFNIQNRLTLIVTLSKFYKTLITAWVKPPIENKVFSIIKCKLKLSKIANLSNHLLTANKKLWGNFVAES